MTRGSNHPMGCDAVNSRSSDAIEGPEIDPFVLRGDQPTLGGAIGRRGSGRRSVGMQPADQLGKGVGIDLVSRSAE